MACSASRNPDIAACVRSREGGSLLRGPHTDSAPMQILDLRRGSETRTLNHVFDPRLHLPSPTVLESRLSALDSIYISPLESKTPLRTVSTPRSGSERDFRASSPSKCGDRRVFVTFASPTPPRRCISSRNRPKASRMHSPVAVAARAAAVAPRAVATAVVAVATVVAAEGMLAEAAATAAAVQRPVAPAAPTALHRATIRVLATQAATTTFRSEWPPRCPSYAQIDCWYRRGLRPHACGLKP